MNCRDILEKLNAYHDCELTRPESLGVEEHLDTCDACRKVFEEITQIDAKLMDLPAIKASSSFDAQLARRMKRGNVLFRILRSRAAQLAVAASLMVAIGVLALNWSRPSGTNKGTFNVEEELPNLSLLDDSGFLGVGTDDAGIGGGLEAQWALSDSQDKEN